MSETADRINMVMGTVLMVIGSVLAIMIFADRTGQSFLPLPHIWHSTREFHIIICLMVFGFAAILLKVPSQREDRGSQPQLFDSVRFFTRNQCDLCDKALTTLRMYKSALGPIEIIDIDQVSEYHERFCDCVPVVEIDGKVRFRGAVQPELLQRLITAAHSRRSKESAPAVSDPTSNGARSEFGE